MRTRLRPLLLSCLLGALAAPGQASFDPLTAVLTLNQVQRSVRQIRSRMRWVRRKLGGTRNRRSAPQMGPLLERMRSPFEEDRLGAAEQVLEIASDYQGRTRELPERGRVEVLLGQLLRDPNWKTRHTAYRALVELEMMEPVEDPGERYALLFPRKRPSRDPLEQPRKAAGPSDVDLLYDFLAALRTRRPGVRTELAAVLESLSELTPPAPTGSSPGHEAAGMVPLEIPRVTPEVLPLEIDERGLF